MYSPKKGPPKKGRQSYWHEKYSRTIKLEPKAFLNEILYEIENGHHFAKREINTAVTCNWNWTIVNDTKAQSEIYKIRETKMENVKKIYMDTRYQMFVRLSRSYFIVASLQDKCCFASICLCPLICSLYTCIWKFSR